MDIGTMASSSIQDFLTPYQAVTLFWAGAVGGFGVGVGLVSVMVPVYWAARVFYGVLLVAIKRLVG